MKAKLHPMFEEVSGQMGEMVFRVVRGKVVVSRKPALDTSTPSEEQIEHRERFKQAVAFGKSVMADAGVRALYEAAAKAKDMPVFALTVADFFNAPTIVSIDATNYNGQAGGTIKIITDDDFGVAKVRVLIFDADQENFNIESGDAIETSEGKGYWLYTAKENAPAGIVAGIQVTATDRPGGTVIQRGTKAI